MQRQRPKKRRKGTLRQRQGIRVRGDAVGVLASTGLKHPFCTVLNVISYITHADGHPMHLLMRGNE